MWKRIKLLAIFCVAVLLIVLLGSPNVVHGETVRRKSDVTAASAGNTLLGVKGSFVTETDAAIARINEIRYEACEKGYPDPRNSSRKLTLDDYVPIKWSTALEMAARLRAAEASVRGSHTRPNGKSGDSVIYGGISSEGEILSWSYDEGMVAGIDNWYEEKQYWIDPEKSGVTGHYEALIDPSYTYYGLGCFVNPDARFSSTVAGAFGGSEGSLGTTPLPEELNIIQEVEFPNSNFNYVIDSDDVIAKGSNQGILLNAKSNFGSYFDCKIYLLDTTPSFSSSNTTVATMNGSTFVAKEEGTTTITAMIGGTAVATKEITVGCPHNYIYDRHFYEYSKTCSICGATESFTYAIYWGYDITKSCSPSSKRSYPVGTEIYIWPAYQQCTNPANKTCSVTSSNPEVISVAAAGYDTSRLLKFNKCGIAVLSIRCKDDPYLDTDLVMRSTGDDKINISEAMVELSDNNFTYTGNAIKPNAKVTYDGIELVQGTDYTISYSENVNAGTGYVVITGMGIFEGTKNKAFTIEGIDISGEGYSASISSDLYYTGSAHTPAVKLYNGSKEMSSSDYTVEVTAQKDAGSYSGYVKGSGNYKGSRTFVWKIEKADPDLGTVSSDMTEIPETLSPLKVSLKSSKTIVAGTLKLTDSALSKSVSSYNYSFTPTDTKNYNSLTGKVTLNVVANRVTGIEVSGTPAKSVYSYGDKFQLAGVTVNAVMLDGTKKDVTSSVTVSELKAGDTKVTLSYVEIENEKTFNAEVTGLTVNKKKLYTTGYSWSVGSYTYNKNSQGPVLTGSVTGIKAEVSGNSKTEAGSYEAVATFSLASGYSSSSYEIAGTNPLKASWSIEKAKPDYEKPTGISAECGDYLTNVVLPKGFTWEGNLTDELNAGDDIEGEEQTFYVTYTPTDTKNYVELNNIAVTVKITHKLSAVNNGDGTHTMQCESCGISGENINHIFLDSEAACQNCDALNINYEGLDKVVKVTSCTYNAAFQSPNVEITGLTKNTDYSVVVVTKKNQGKYTATIQGKGKYSGTRAIEWSIDKAKLTPVIQGTASKVYDGTANVPEDNSLKVSVEGALGKDVITAAGTFEYDTADAGSLVKINATGITVSGSAAANYELVSSTVSAKVGEILPLSIEKAEVTLSGNLTYNGKKQTMGVASVKINGLDATFEVSDNSGTDAGDYTLTVSGTGNFTGVAYKSFRISKAKNAPNMPDATKDVIIKPAVTKLSDVLLPMNWQWKNGDTELPRTETSFDAEAVYAGADSGNYENVTVSISINMLDRSAEITSFGGIYVVSADTEKITAIASVDFTGYESAIEYKWFAKKDGSDIVPIQGFNNVSFINWTPSEYGEYDVYCQVRANEDDSTIKETVTHYSYHPIIKGVCQMPNEGGGFLIGLESYNNPNNEYTYELSILDCTLYAQGLDAWTYSTGRCSVDGNCLWTIWDPVYGYYWTLFRVYDKDGKLIDEVCYGFQNI